MKTTLTLILTGALMFLSSCSSNKVDVYKDTKPELHMEEFFNGNIKAWGILQNYSGKVTRQFDIDMVGTWDGNKGKLEEKFTFYDGETNERTWHITKLADGTYEGTASDIYGKAEGKASGSAIHWVYSMALPVDDTTYKIKFDDWMFQMNDGVLMNRSYLKKFGITVAELTIFMQKQD